MQEYRWDALHGRWVIIAANRGWRPGAQRNSEAAASTTADCPFCPGHESQTPNPLYVDRGAGLRDDEPWRIRVVPNLFEAVRMLPDPPEPLLPPGPFTILPAHGMHEVFVETPRHAETLGSMTREHLAALFGAFQMRLQAAQSAGLACAVVFKNFGKDAGASLDHPHSQMIALPFVPPALADEARALSRDACYLCQALGAERSGERVVVETANFWAWAPIAGAYPYETMVLPKQHMAHFYSLERPLLFELAQTLQQVWRATGQVLGDVPVNYIVHSAPFGGTDFHWHIEIIPRTSRLGGFELGTGSFINPSSPEASAAKLREALAGNL